MLMTFKMLYTDSNISTPIIPGNMQKKSTFCSGSQLYHVPVEEASAEPAPIELMGCSARVYLKFQAAPI